MFEEFGINAGFVEELHTRWLQSPQSVEAGWREFFERPNGAPPPATVEPPVARKNGTTNGNGAAAYRQAVRESVITATELQSRVAQLVNAYRVRGHAFAKLDPLEKEPEAHPELELSNFGLSAADLDQKFSTAGMSGLPDRATLRQIVDHLSETYCSSIGVEFTHVEEPEPRLWLQDRMESSRNHASLDQTELRRILGKLVDAEILEQFIHKNYVGAKRFSLEGAESLIPMMDLLVEAACASSSPRSTTSSRSASSGRAT